MCFLCSAANKTGDIFKLLGDFPASQYLTSLIPQRTQSHQTLLRGGAEVGYYLAGL